jgi:hypothetical protein
MFIVQYVLNNSISDTPSNKIELSDGCGKALKFNAFGPAKGIE